MSNEHLIGAPQQAVMAFKVLDQVNDLSIYQKTSKIEALTAMTGSEWDRPNKYNIQSGGKDLFYAAEQTGCFRRQMKAFCPDCMSWEVKFFVKTGGGFMGMGGGWDEAFDLQRPWQLTCCCFNRPRAALTAANDSSKVFGYISNPCSPCPSFTVLNSNEEPMLYASTSGFQPGLYWPCPFGPCAHVKFDIQDAQGNDIGSIDKEIPCGRCCCKFCAPGQDVDNYHLDLSRVADSNAKALLMALAVFIDLRFFSGGQEKDNTAPADGGGDGGADQ